MITVDDIRQFEGHKTPFYFYDLQLLRRTVRRAQEQASRYGYHVHYAMKANTDDEILRLMLSEGLGVDCVSGGEVAKGIQMGFDPKKIAFAGVGKTDDEIKMAIERFADAGFRVEHINAGGGLGINYDTPDSENDPDFERFFALFDELLDLGPGQELHFELGRSLVAHCGDLITRALYVKKGVKTNFLILDAGMTELIRPALYQAIHRIENLTRRGNGIDERYDVVGPVCESSDCFGKAMPLPESERGDLIAIRSAGAYGASMASNYKLRQLEPSVYRK